MRHLGDVEMPAAAAGMPDPGDALIERVAGTTDRPWFYWAGRESVRELERTLAIVGRSIDSFDSILDFGCGCGRMLLWLSDVGEKSSLYGTDIDPEAIAWAEEHIPYATFSVNPPDPPLPFGEGVFDLVYNHSVFTHIDERRQDEWLAELHRVTRPGGLLVLSTSGEHALRGLEEHAAAYEQVRGQLEREGISFVDKATPPEFSLPDWYQATFHAPWYIFERWGQWFDIRGFVPGAALAMQDHILLERTPETRPQPLAARPAGTRSCVGPPDASVQAAPQFDDVSTLARAVHADAQAMPSRFGSAGRLARHALLRLMRPFSAPEERLDNALAEAIDELARFSRQQASRLESIERRVGAEATSTSRSGRDGHPG